MSEKTVIEVNGVKLEVDLRHARRIDEIRVGDRVKVLTKKYDGYEVHAGVVIGFEPFKNLPTIIVAYVATNWQAAEIKFVHFNAQAKDVEIVKAIDDDKLDLDKENVIAALDKEVATKRAEIEAIEHRRAYFLRNFASYWEAVEKPAANEPAF